jgi:SAM-dependent methyltransferase
MMKKFWNERYANSQYAYGTEPNAFFKSQIDQRPAGRILLPAEGEGRNAVYAAKRGWDVVAFDQSEAGEKKAMKLAQAAKTSITYRIEDAMSFNEETAFDLLFYGFFHVPPVDLQPIYDHLNSFLKPGGQVLLEGFSTKNIGRGSGGPQNEAMLFSTSRVTSLLHDLKTLEVWEEEIILNEGPFHQGNARVIRAIGVK